MQYNAYHSLNSRCKTRLATGINLPWRFTWERPADWPLSRPEFS